MILSAIIIDYRRITTKIVKFDGYCPENQQITIIKPAGKCGAAANNKAVTPKAKEPQS